MFTTNITRSTLLTNYMKCKRHYLIMGRVKSDRLPNLTDWPQIQAKFNAASDEIKAGLICKQLVETGAYCRYLEFRVLEELKHHKLSIDPQIQVVLDLLNKEVTTAYSACHLGTLTAKVTHSV